MNGKRHHFWPNNQLDWTLTAIGVIGVLIVIYVGWLG